MELTGYLTASCRHCRFYDLEGRRGGHCHLLGAPVRGGWKACSMGASPFAQNWTDLEKMMVLDVIVPDAHNTPLEVNAPLEAVSHLTLDHEAIIEPFAY